MTITANSLASMVLLSCFGCTAGPLPDPPYVDWQEAALLPDGEDSVRVVGNPGAVNRPLVTACNLDGSSESVETLASEDGSFDVATLGALDDAYAVWTSSCGHEYSPNQIVRFDSSLGQLVPDVTPLSGCLAIEERVVAPFTQVGSSGTFAVGLANHCRDEVAYSLRDTPLRVGGTTFVVAGEDGTLAPGQSASISLMFTPPSRGHFEDELFIEVTSPEVGTRFTVITGDASDPLPAAVYAAGSTHRFTFPISGLQGQTLFAESTVNAGFSWEPVGQVELSEETFELLDGEWSVLWQIPADTGTAQVRARTEADVIVQTSEELTMGPSQEDDGYVWTQATEHAGFSPRDSLGVAVLGDTMYAMGGLQGEQPANDVWSTTNGADWTLVVEHAPWGRRSVPTVPVFNGSMWVVSGYSDGPSGDVWRSADGATWERVADGMLWRQRSGPVLQVYNDRMWMMGGANSYQSFNDVWSTCDGATWFREAESVGWTPRGFVSGAVEHEGYMWLLGGGTYDEYHPETDTIDSERTLNNDVWRTIDGIHWERVLEHAPWAQTEFHVQAEWDGKLWSGFGYTGLVPSLGFTQSDAMWYSSDGFNWYRVDAPAGQAPRGRFGAGVGVFNGSLWILGGSDIEQETVVNDVWSLSDSTP